jgi:hypothetical protein
MYEDTKGARPETRLPDRLELRQRIFLMSRGQSLALWASGLLVAVTTVTSVFLLFRNTNHSDQLASALFAKLARNPLDTLLHTLPPILIVGYLLLAQRRERLILTPTGIQYRSPLPGALQFLRPSWSLPWSRIRGAALKSGLRGPGPRALVLELDDGTRRLKLFPYQWVDPERDQPVLSWQEVRALQKATPEVALAVVRESEIMRYIAAAAPQLVSPGNIKLADAVFALEKNPRTLTLVIVFFVLLFYALGDTFVIGHETYAGPAPYNAFLACGVLAALAAVTWMWRGRVPVAESLLVALLFGGAFGAAMYPGALRLNAVTDTEGLRTYQYRRARDRQLQPLVEGPPALAFPQYYEYWAQFPAGSLHEFELRKGGLGFYQINMQPVNEVLHDFYAAQRTTRRPAR